MEHFNLETSSGQSGGLQNILGKVVAQAKGGMAEVLVAPAFAWLHNEVLGLALRNGGAAGSPLELAAAVIWAIPGCRVLRPHPQPS